MQPILLIHNEVPSLLTWYWEQVVPELLAGRKGYNVWFNNEIKISSILNNTIQHITLVGLIVCYVPVWHSLCQGTCWSLIKCLFKTHHALPISIMGYHGPTSLLWETRNSIRKYVRHDCPVFYSITYPFVVPPGVNPLIPHTTSQWGT